MGTNYTNMIKLINFFKLHQNHYVELKKLINLLGTDPNNVIKIINKIQLLGYVVEFHPIFGYKLNKFTKTMFPWEVKRNLKTKILGNKIYYFNKLTSTQDFALKIVEKHENGAVIISDTQVEGRGRYGRKWLSDKGSLCFSVIIYPDISVPMLNFFSIVAALALSITIEGIIKLKPVIKYPNDVLLNGKKVAGILIDSSIEYNVIHYVIIGFGINFDIDTDYINNKLQELGSNYHAGTLLHHESFTKIQFLQSLLFEFESLIKRLEDNDMAYIIQNWNKYSK
ncbi:MAG: biotin--[acetyl-CoA-carboxylase] ligase [Thaumarchaeota archaeon]|nr:biotin--[acetyl-CoA-carboxylase] ligase [Nitrososphaerota archaeon]MCY3975549.1 biotin--[acetyl-CoA-carboxylase] ligase [Nitrososphaerota archaeon]